MRIVMLPSLMNLVIWKAQVQWRCVWHAGIGDVNRDLQSNKLCPPSVTLSYLFVLENHLYQVYSDLRYYHIIAR